MERNILFRELTLKRQSRRRQPENFVSKPDAIIYKPLLLQIYHFGNAEVKGDTILFNAVCLGPKFNMTFENKIWLSNASVSPGYMFQFTIDFLSKKCHRSKEPDDPASVEFPTVHQYRHGVPTRYAYLMASDRKGYNLPYRDVIKVSTFL